MMAEQDRTAEKYENLCEILESSGGAAIAFSGGVDSTLLLRAACDALKENVLAITAKSPLFPDRETSGTEEYCKEHGVRQVLFETDAMKTPGFRENPADRCYICKRELFLEMKKIASENGFDFIAEGSNADDESDYRPGMRAVRELGIRSPLREAGLAKAEIRELSARLGLPTASKPSLACLASRFAYGESITEQKLRMVDRGEAFLRSEGFTQVRVRIHGNLARIELLPGEIGRFLADDMRIRTAEAFRKIGFAYISLDLEGYRTGSMNETLNR